MIQVTFAQEDVKEIQNIALTHLHEHVRGKGLALLLKSENVPHWQICKIINICENTLRTYFKEYIENGIGSITTLNFNKPESVLKPFREQIKEYLKKTPPTSIKQACSEIEKFTGVLLKESQMRSFLKSLDATYQKAGSIPAKADIEKQKDFLENKLNPRLEEAKWGKRTVYFMDAAHFVWGAFLGYLWCITRVFVKAPSGRQRFNVLGALDAITKEMLLVTNTTYITSTQVCEMLEKIAQKHMNPLTGVMAPVSIVLDNAKYQRCDVVQNKAKAFGIELLYLPSYSPNLNLIERTWKFAKKHCLNSKYYPNFVLFKDAINNFLNTMNDAYRSELYSLLTLKFQTFTEDQLRSLH